MTLIPSEPERSDIQIQQVGMSQEQARAIFDLSDTAEQSALKLQRITQSILFRVEIPTRYEDALLAEEARRGRDAFTEMLRILGDNEEVS